MAGPLNRHRFRGLILALLFVGLGLAVWTVGLPLSWTADDDRVAYQRLKKAIEADPQRLLNTSFDEFSREYGLEDVPWDDGSIQQPPGMYRIYHFRGFALYVTLDRLPPGTRPSGSNRWSMLEGSRVLWFVAQVPSVRVDGIRDPKERMRLYWKAVEEASRQINEGIERGRQINR